MMIGQKLRAIRTESGLSIAKLAAKASVSPDYVVRIEHGKLKNAGVEKLKQLAHALNVPITDFFTDSLPEEACHE